jgi:hypothetical protein
LKFIVENVYQEEMKMNFSKMKEILQVYLELIYDEKDMKIQVNFQLFGKE